MELRFSELTSKKEKCKAINLVVEEDTIYIPGEIIKVLKPITFDGFAKVVEDVITLEGNISAELELECSRCLKNFSTTVNTSIDEKFSNNFKEDESIVPIESDILDVSEIIANNVISTLPIKRLCDEQCKGLCQTCGADLNLHQCSCSDLDTDIRFEKLKELFKQ
ncbi:MAG: YceD family protein [Sarcina sp.]